MNRDRVLSAIQIIAIIVLIALSGRSFGQVPVTASKIYPGSSLPSKCNPSDVYASGTNSSRTFSFCDTKDHWSTVTTGGGTSFPLLAPDGNAGAPSYSFTSNTSGGLFGSASTVVLSNAGGDTSITLNNDAGSNTIAMYDDTAGATLTFAGNNITTSGGGGGTLTLDATTAIALNKPTTVTGDLTSTGNGIFSSGNAYVRAGNMYLEDNIRAIENFGNAIFRTASTGYLADSTTGQLVIGRTAVSGGYCSLVNTSGTVLCSSNANHTPGHNDNPADNLNISSGAANGLATLTDIIFVNHAYLGISGSAEQPGIDVGIQRHVVLGLSNTVFKDFFDFTLANNSVGGGSVNWCVRADDGTDFQSTCGEVAVACVNKAGTVTSNASILGTAASITTSGTQIITFNVTNGSGKCTLQIKNTSAVLSPTTINAMGWISSLSDVNGIVGK